jgi:hypothetical protein
MKTATAMGLGFMALVSVACAPSGSVEKSASPVLFETPGGKGSGKQFTTSIVSISETLPDFPADAAPASLDALAEDTVVRLDLRLPQNVMPQVRKGSAWEALSCDPGPSSGFDEISVQTGSNHLLLSIMPGSPALHAANFVSCDYSVPSVAPQIEGGADTLPVRLRIKGCYLVHESAIPTARQLILHPLPASNCLSVSE